MEDDFLTRVVSELTREILPPDLLLAISEGLLGVVIAGGCLGHGNPEMIEFSLFGEVRKVVSRTATLNF